MASGENGAVLWDQALDYNSDPRFVAEMTLHRLIVEAEARLRSSGLSMREVARRLGTSVPQLYRLLETGRTSTGFVQLFALLQLLGCDPQVVIKPEGLESKTKKPVRRKSRQRAAA